MRELTEQERRARLVIAWLNVAAAAISLLYLVWAMTPEHRRQELGMRLADSTRRQFSRLAAAAGQAAMRAELDGRPPAYEVPYALSLARDAAARRYEKLRQAW